MENLTRRDWHMSRVIVSLLVLMLTFPSNSARGGSNSSSRIIVSGSIGRTKTLDSATLMLLICLTASLDPVVAIVVRNGVYHSAVVELVGSADNCPVLLVLLWSR